MEIFGVFSMNGIENYPAAGENFLENVILKVSQTHFFKDFYPKGGGGGINFSRGGCEVPCLLRFLATQGGYVLATKMKLSGFRNYNFKDSK